MTLPITERIILATVAQLATINTSAGYSTTPSAVLRSVSVVNEGEPPILVVWAITERSTGGNEGFSLQLELTLQIDAFVPANATTTGAALELIKADVKRALLSLSLATAINDASVKTDALRYTGSTASPRADGAGLEAVALTFTVAFREKFGDPTKS